MENFEKTNGRRNLKERKRVMEHLDDDTMNAKERKTKVWID